ncbi:MAG TPA: hypothetical protein VIM48_09125 [Chthoniobacterales bacterium]
MRTTCMTQKLHRIEVEGEGAGEFSEADIHRRAAELALADGRYSPNEADLSQARAELASPEAPGDIAEQIAEEDRPDAGVPATEQPLRATAPEATDEETDAERLVEEGIEEAVHDDRVHSNDDL